MQNNTSGELGDNS